MGLEKIKKVSNNEILPLTISKQESRLYMSFIYVAIISLLIGGLMGLLQTLVRSNTITLPWGIGYYQILTLHGVVLALVLTTYFIIGFQFALMGKTVGISLKQRKVAWLSFWVMIVGTVMAAITILMGKASVLYTFYAPLKAHPVFYIGLALVIVGSWIAGFVNWHQLFVWKKKHPGEKSPLLAFMVAINMAMWFIASLGVAVAVLVQFIPWSLGYAETINVLVSRTLFWYFGHPLVYFWLLPAYMAWYAIIPKIIGGKIFSDSLARLSFILFLFFSIPVGFHHQLTEPGIDPVWKFIQVVLTFMVIIPSLMTAFSMFATFEITGRRKGFGGLFGWLKHLPWKDVRFLAPFIGMLAFIPGGAGGIINASHQMNAVVHNTIWVTGHFHLTVATTVILTFFGISYWLIPHLTGRKLTPQLNRLGIIQTIVWTVGMTIMSGAMHIQGLLGGPRRSAFSEYGGTEQASNWIGYQLAQAIGGSILFIGIILMLYIFIKLAFFAPKGIEEFPIAEEEEDAEPTPMFLENWKLWIAITLALILFAYTIPFVDIIQNSPPGSPPFSWPIGN
ncbi:b(o/a)3-type cytochrome-c oxidase subunit 1 [Virgibacillus halodenitrificans]|uniref:B(O/a)3-type cytochrome-c oxidase subunit 1 n=1 Tax=Virgibacillus halodenitrificans TaxID=1482 RepID=A0ABR7VKW3_VIRHA|nr:b(o/a)3-type cytochrome-c oxidase subunit 1 [Virgibacillus halodenitrificans]MBD1222567.1 b(o/a)3-type cytochrome-c oxidase subunit 1 [Virgibacillus halodenitrificans]MCG1028349.1 b(o/a)3-type cytochrome-c oxidase subunit 1 [Virgibacillus halodenitrificans]MEC2160438.1 b(o/a)3-type cytochrome-c oxidase subunit 1 [Virgibacillus halodenitrificans]MYL58230.1 cytochrome C [Virgibacillus halodenitrificans]CDQ35685.1 Cytochrome c oxidase subunit 1 [Virgibacillus halodenitrificans]